MGGYSPYEPFGPHGPAGSPTSVRPNPTPADVPMNLGGGDAGSWPTYGVSGGGGGTGVAYSGAGATLILRVVGAIFTFFALLTFPIPLACLYPLTAAVAFVAAILARPFLGQIVGGDPDGVRVCTVGVVLVATYAFMRVEYRLARNPLFRAVRHGLRLVLFAILGVPTMLFAMSPDKSMTYTVFVLDVFARPALMMRLLASPVIDAILAACVIGLHFLLWRADHLRDFWHRRLKSVGLK
jgi:hypothetical protein